MQPFKTLTAIAAPLLRDNIDTDAIIPSREITTVSRTGLAAGLFAGWRYKTASSREPDPGFVLNQIAYAGARILLCGDNFGCGSSREHAVWALYEYGIRAVLAPSFAPIFFANCVNNGLLAGCASAATLQTLTAAICTNPRVNSLTIDLEHSEVAHAASGSFRFDIDAEARLILLGGLDAIDRTLRVIADVDAFQTDDRSQRPWVYLDEST